MEPISVAVNISTFHATNVARQTNSTVKDVIAMIVSDKIDRCGGVYGLLSVVARATKRTNTTVFFHIIFDDNDSNSKIDLWL